MKTSNKIALGMLATIMFCFGGLLTIGLIVGPPDEPAASKTADSAARQPLLAAPVSSPTVAPPAVNTTSSPPASPTRATEPTTPAATRTATRKPAPATTRPKPKPTTKKPRPKPSPTRDEPEQVYYKNCAAVRAAGAAPIHRGDPGYARHLDRDNDGVGCAGD